MLVLTRKVGESVVIDGRIVVKVVRVEGDQVRLGIQAPGEVPVHRQEVYDEIERSNREALTEGAPRIRRKALAGPSGAVEVDVARETLCEQKRT